MFLQQFKNKRDINKNYQLQNYINIPQEKDWRQEGAVTRVKQQGQCGSCWAFSAIGALESLNFIRNRKLQEFSEQQLIDCSIKNKGCHGGLSQNAFSYVIQNGLTTENEYPYSGINNETCKNFQEFFRIRTYYNVIEENEDQFITALAQQPLSTYIDAGSIKFQLYGGGIFDYSDCGDDLDHVILAVAYDQDSITIKNSWGDDWGENGFMRLKRTGNGQGMCGIYLDPNYPSL